MAVLRGQIKMTDFS